MNCNYSYYDPNTMNKPVYNTHNTYNGINTNPNPTYNPYEWRQNVQLRDYGPNPFVINIEQAAMQNPNYRTALWTGKHLQVTLMSIPVGGDIGLEIHPNLDQFLRIEEGQGVAKMGEQRDRLNFERNVAKDFAIIVPAGTWHNLINTGNKPLKLYSIYAPVKHPYGTVQRTKAEAMAEKR